MLSSRYSHLIEVQNKYDVITTILVVLKTALEYKWRDCIYNISKKLANYIKIYKIPLSNLKYICRTNKRKTKSLH